MLKKLIIIIFLLYLPSILANDYEYKRVGDFVQEGKLKLTIIDIGQTDIHVNVNGVLQSIALNQSKLVNTLNITVKEIFYHANPGDRLASFSASQTIPDICLSDLDCNDNDACTLDRCTGLPGSCTNDDSHVDIKDCISNDGCCPGNCNYLNDNDCNICETDDDCREDDDSCTTAICQDNKCVLNQTTICVRGDGCCPEGCFFSISSDVDCSKRNKCASQFDCNDYNYRTLDKCDYNDQGFKECIHRETYECIDGDNVCPVSCDENTDIDCKDIPKQLKCISHETCDDFNPCTNNICSQGICIFVGAGCHENDKCYDIGTVKDGFYCYNDWLILKDKEQTCNENYECKSGKCVDNLCIKPSFFSSLILFFKDLF